MSPCIDMSTVSPLFALRFTASELPSANTSTGDVDIPLWNKSAVFSIRTRFLIDLFDVLTIYGTSNKARASNRLLLPTLGLPISTLMRRQSESVIDFTDLKFLIETLLILVCADFSIMCKFTKIILIDWLCRGKYLPNYDLRETAPHQNDHEDRLSSNPSSLYPSDLHGI